MDIAKHRLEHGANFPYDAGADFWEDRNPKPALQQIGRTLLHVACWPICWTVEASSGNWKRLTTTCARS